nr:HAMP domain-containing sensor histidine kinase [uncultured Agathobaculum sp.]
MSGYVAVIAVLCAAAVVLWSRWRIARTIKRLDQMLTAAMNDSFTETDFDESRLSALENRLARYLAASSLSARQVQGQKDQISTWISDISHQTKTPVANVLLYTQLLAEQPLTPQGKDCVHAIATQAEKLQALIQALVKTSRLENGILVLHPQMGEIAPVVQRAVAQYAPRAAEKGLTLTAEAVEGTAVFDPKWTEEALCNLLDNAVKYTPPGGAVRVEVRSYELFAAVCVIDTGPGIPESEQAQIFERFHRAPEAYQQAGVGIGLYLTRQIAASQGGYVRVNSAPGKGSTFSLYLPRETPEM